MSDEGRSRRSVVVVGGGVSGLTVAFELRERARARGVALDLTCVEESERPGGNIRSETDRGFRCESGPTGFLDNAPATLELVRRIGLEDRLLPARPEASNRFIFRNGKLRPVPMGPGAFLGSGILSPAGKLRLLGEPFAGGPRRDDESVYEFAARRIGSEAASVLVDAMVSGIYAGNVRQLSLRATFPKMHRMESDHGSLFRAMLARRKTGGGGGPAGPGGRLTSFRDGLDELTGRLAERLADSLRLACPVRQVADMGRRGYRVVLERGTPIEADAVVLACPAWRARALVEATDGAMAEALGGIPSASLAVVHLGYRTLAMGDQPSGFGFLVPRGQGPRILGTLWITDIFEGRAPQGSSLLTSMIGGAHDPQAVELDDATLIQTVREDLTTTMGLTAEPYFTRIVRWHRGIPQYTLGHLERLARIEERLAGHPGLFVCGNSYRGISVNACVEEAPGIADAVLERLGETAGR